MIGAMAMPVNFQYRDVFLKGYPQHEQFDEFRLKHPCMKPGRRARLFNPFDALKGFDEAVAEKETVYVTKRHLSEGEIEKLDQTLRFLRELTANSKLARAHHVCATVTRFIPCADPDSYAYGKRGQYVTVTGTVWNVDAGGILLDDQRIPFRDILNITDVDFIDVDFLEVDVIEVSA